MKDRFRFRAGIKTKSYNFVVNVDSINNDYFVVTFDDIENVVSLEDEELWYELAEYCFKEVDCLDGWTVRDFSILMQCTGKMDRKSKLIYSGDILRRYNTSGLPYKKDKVVEWDGQGFTNLDNIDSSEVVGNIYENKELLEQ